MLGGAVVLAFTASLACSRHFARVQWPQVGCAARTCGTLPAYC